jgi:hypothetical protein
MNELLEQLGILNRHSTLEEDLSTRSIQFPNIHWDFIAAAVVQTMAGALEKETFDKADERVKTLALAFGVEVLKKISPISALSLPDFPPIEELMKQKD